MSTLDDQDLFGSGPHSIRPESWSRAIETRAFPGIDGELVLDMGLRYRRIIQTGRLQSDSASGILSLLSAAEATLDGESHVLVDDLGCTYPSVLVEKFEPTTPARHGQGFWCDYTIVYRQLI